MQATKLALNLFKMKLPTVLLQIIYTAGQKFKTTIKIVIHKLLDKILRSRYKIHKI